MEKEAFNELLKRYEVGRCTPAEAARVEEWFHTVAKHAPEPAGEPDYSTLGKRLYREMGIPKARPSVVVRWLPYAAAILVMLSIGIGIYWYTGNGKVRSQLTSEYGDDVLPGGNRATLTLADGKTISLSESKHGVVVQSNELLYDDGTQISSASGTTSEYVTLTTPNGGQYQITLPDGSKIWLNAASSLRYPIAFNGNQRAVELSGEAYFEITHDQEKPFTVENHAQIVEVLGTRFNIDAYENHIATTLLSGSVKVSSTREAQKTVTLKPGQQAILDAHDIFVQPVNAADYTAWKDGLILLNNAEIHEVAKEIERWYDVSFDIPKGINKGKAYILLNRKEKLSQILSVLSKTYEINFSIKGKEVTVIE